MEQSTRSSTMVWFILMVSTASVFTKMNILFKSLKCIHSEAGAALIMIWCENIKTQRKTKFTKD
jgi:hypothetical protein